MRQFILATGFNADLAAANAGQLSIIEAGTDDSAGGNVGLNWVLKRTDDKGGNILYPFYPKDFTYVKSVYKQATAFTAKFTIAEVVPYQDYTVTFVKKGTQFNERSNWSAVIHSGAADTPTALGDKIVKFVKDNKATLGLTAENAAGTVTVTGPATGEDYTITLGDALFGTKLTSVTQGVKAVNDAAAIKDMFAKCAADAGFEYTYDDFDIYPGFEFNPLAQADKADTGFMVYTLRFTEPRVMGTREEAVYQIIQIAFPTGTTVTEFEAKLEEFVVDVR